jgi:hypothetical protein
MHGLRYSINSSDIAQKFNDVVIEFLETHDPQLGETVLTLAEELTREVRINYPDLEIDPSFDREVVLDSVQAILSETRTTTPARIVVNTAYTKVKEHIHQAQEPKFDSFDAFSYSVDVPSKLLLEEKLHDLFEEIPLRIRAAILYLLYVPEHLNRFEKICSFAEYVFLIRTMFRLKDQQSLKISMDSALDFTLPTTQIARLLLVSSLYKLSPAILVLLFLLKDVNLLYQFCLLFGEKTVTIPSLETFAQTIQKSAQLASKLESQGISIGDRESLALLATELDDIQAVDSNAVLNPVLSAFFEEMIHITLDNYERMQRKLVDSVDLSDPNDIVRVYEIMNRELTTQVNLVLQISGSVDTAQDLARIIATLQQKFDGRVEHSS